MPVLTKSNGNCFCEPGPGTGIFQDYCQILYPDTELQLCELNVDQRSLPYYVSVKTDGPDPILVLSLDKYVSDSRGVNRRTDFLIAGQNPCKQVAQIFIVFLELRDHLLTEENWDDKRQQCIEAVELLCKNVTNYNGLHDDPSIRAFLTFLPHDFAFHRVAAVVIPALLSKSRALGTHEQRIGNKYMRVTALPDSFFKKTISWKQLLKVMGLINC